MIKNISEFYCPMSSLIEALIAEKKMLDYKYQSGIELLRQLDRFWLKYEKSTPTMTRELGESFIRHGSPDGTLRGAIGRAGIWRQLALFARRQGLDAYCPEIRSLPVRGATYTPFIYTREQVARLFRAADSLEFDFRSPRRSVAMGLLLRLLYGTGLRLGEALSLRYHDLDSEAGILIVRQGKNQKTRLAPMAPSLANRMTAYRELYPGSPDTPVFLSPLRFAPIDPWTVQSLFPKLLKSATLPPRAEGTGPRIHDLRHTFAVHRMENWLKANENLESKIPVLSAYMGHSCLRETYYYLRLTSQLFPTLTMRFQAYVGNIIPEGGD